MARDLVDPKGDRHRMAETAQMREAHAGKGAFLRRVSRREHGEVAVGKREDRHVAGGLTEIARFDDVVERRRTGLKQMHGPYPSRVLAMASRSRPFSPMTTRFPRRVEASPQGRS